VQGCRAGQGIFKDRWAGWRVRLGKGLDGERRGTDACENEFNGIENEGVENFQGKDEGKVVWMRGLFQGVRGS